MVKINAKRRELKFTTWQPGQLARTRISGSSSDIQNRPAKYISTRIGCFFPLEVGRTEGVFFLDLGDLHDDSWSNGIGSNRPRWVVIGEFGVLPGQVDINAFISYRAI